MSCATARRPKAAKTTQLEATRLAILDGEPRTLKQIAAIVRRKTRRPATEAGVSARLRDLRKPPYSLNVTKLALARKGVFLYGIPAPVESVTGIDCTNAARPIVYGTAESNAEPAPNTPVAGSRSALAFANSLK